MRIGFHVPVGRGLREAARRAHAIGCECLQVFVRNPRGWRARSYEEREVEAFRQLLAEHDIHPVAVHSCYVVNLASPDAALLDRSRRAVADDMRRAQRLGATMVSLHSGNHMGAGTEAGLHTLAQSVRWLLGRAPAGVMLLLENSAGAGSQLGSEWSHFARLWEVLDGDERLGITFDTCHAHSAGHRLDTPRRIGQVLREFDAALGLERLRLVHLNDCQGPAGSRVDRHEHIGRGTIGDRGLRALLRRRELQDRCAILETPLDRPDADARNIRHARELAGKPRRRGRVESDR